MATITANTGSNNWNTNAAWVGGVQPTAADDVVIPSSAVVTIPASTTVLARSVTVDASGTLVFAATTSTLNIGDATAGAGNVALSISATATITLTGIGTINFISTSTTVQTVTSGGKTLPQLVFNGVGGSWKFQDGITVNGTITIASGTLDTNNQAVSAGLNTASGTNTKVLTLGSTVWTLTTLTLALNGTGLTLNANTSTITCSIAGALRVIGPASGLTLYNLTRIGTAVKTDSIQVEGGNLTINGTLTLNSNSDVNRLLVLSNTVGTQRTITAAAVIITNTVDFQDIAGAGAATWTVAGTGATMLGDCGGNSGITFTASATQTYGGGDASFSWSDPTKWTSRVPLPQDDVVISQSFATLRTITTDMPRMGRNIDCSGVTGAGGARFQTGTNPTIFGSLTLSSAMSVVSGAYTFGGRGSYTLTSAGKTFPSNVTISAPGGTYTLQDAFNCSGTLTGTANAGTLSTNNFTVTASVVTINTGFTFSPGTSTVNLTSTAAVTILSWNASGSGDASLASFIITAASTNSRTFAGGGHTYGTLTYTVAGSTGALVISGANTFNTINFSDATNGRTLSFTSGVTNSVTNLNASGSSGKQVAINSTTGGTQATLSLPANTTVSLDYVSIKDIACSGGQIEAGKNSSDLGNCSRVSFNNRHATMPVFT